MNDSEGCRRVWCPSDEVKQRVLFFFHRRAAPARFAAIPTWRRRWAVGALGARPDTYTLRRIEVALVLHNGFSTHTSGSDMAECRAPADERRKKMVRERQNHNGGKQQGSKQLSNSKD